MCRYKSPFLCCWYGSVADPIAQICFIVEKLIGDYTFITEHRNDIISRWRTPTVQKAIPN